MSQPVRINAYFSTQSGKLMGNVVVEGPEDELFLTAVTRAVREQLDADYSGRPAGLVWRDPDTPEELRTIVPEGTTMAAVREYFGDEVAAEPPTIHIDEGGYGGAPDFIPYAFDLVNTGMQVAGYVSATLAAQRAITKIRYRRFHELANDWNDSDYITPELREAVRTQHQWRRKDFDKTFGLDESRGPKLLRELGFTRRDYDWDQVWERPWDE